MDNNLMWIIVKAMETPRSLKMNKKADDLVFRVSEPSDNAQIVYNARRMLLQIGFDETRQYLIASAVSELSTNIIRYAKKGTITLRCIKAIDKSGFEVIAQDYGPGIPDIQKATMENYSSGDGLGLGLSSVKRIMDECEIKSSQGQGTCIIAKKWLI